MELSYKTPSYGESCISALSARASLRLLFAQFVIPPQQAKSHINFNTTIFQTVLQYIQDYEYIKNTNTHRRNQCPFPSHRAQCAARNFALNRHRRNLCLSSRNKARLPSGVYFAASHGIAQSRRARKSPQGTLYLSSSQKPRPAQPYPTSSNHQRHIKYGFTHHA